MNKPLGGKSSGLPKPSSGLKPPQIINKPTAKRPLESTSSKDLSVNLPKRQRSTVTNLTKGTNLSRSMMHIPKTKSTSRLPPIANITGRPSAIASRSAMSDRTNQAKTADDVKAEKSGSSNAQTKPKKRAPWDVKGQLEDVRANEIEFKKRLLALETQNQNLNTKVEEKETVVAQSKIETEDLVNKVSHLTKENDVLKKRIETSEDEFKEQLRIKTRLIDDLEYSKSSADRRIRSLEDELNSKQVEVAGLKTTVAELTSSSAGFEARLKSSESSLKDAKKMVEELEKLSTAQQSTIEAYQETQRTSETERRKLHNTIQELKGNIRVFCRVRPLLPGEDEASRSGSKSCNGQIPHIVFTGDRSLEIIRAADKSGSISTSVSGKSEKFPFEFDHVFQEQASQESIFEEVSQLVQSSIDGYNVCIFAYGQTGSGKTFTMEGDDSKSEQGIIPRTLMKIFEEANNLQEKGWSYKIEANFVEIYNEEIRDLLTTDKGLKHDIKRVDAKSNEIYVTNLTTEDVTDGQNIDQLLRRARKARAVAATNCNERSSRSHSVFILKIQGSNSKTGESCTGSLNLVDLAGSERLKDSGSTGQRLEETKNINTSLTSLSKVIMALANNKDGHIPYRDSKLTHLLMNSLGGNSKTLMFVNLSPREESFNESLNSLRFAKRVNQCQIGTASKKIANPL